MVSRNAVFEPPHGNGEGNEVQTTTEKVKRGGGKMEGSDRGTGTGMDMNFVFKYMCLITYVSLLLSVIDCADGVGERESGADSLCYTKGNLRERWNK